MRLILFEGTASKRADFHPLSLNRPIWELRCGLSALGEKLLGRFEPCPVACFVPPYMAGAYRAVAAYPVNDPAVLAGDDLLLLNARLHAERLNLAARGRGEIGQAPDGDLLYVRVPKEDAARLPHGDLKEFLSAAKASLPTVPCELPTWNYIWELVAANGQILAEEFRRGGRSGIEGQVEQPFVLRGNVKDVFIATGATLHPMTVIDAENGPVFIDQGAQVHPFTRIEGPCYVGRDSILLGAKCRSGMSIGPACRVGGEVEGSIIQGYSNKYHDGFLGHAYVGQWVNLGALTTNSDLKNDYSNVSVVLDGKKAIPTGSIKAGAIIGDHARTSIGTLLNTGAYVGAMTMIVTAGKLLPKFLPSFAWYLQGDVGEGRGKEKFYETARAVLARRGQQWTAPEEAMWDAIHELTAPQRQEAMRRNHSATSQ